MSYAQLVFILLEKNSFSGEAATFMVYHRLEVLLSLQ